jgi:hypothetical protein
MEIASSKEVGVPVELMSMKHRVGSKYQKDYTASHGKAA